MNKRTNASTQYRLLGFALAGLFVAGFASAAIANTDPGSKDVPVASAEFSAYSDVKEYAGKHACEKPTDETVHECEIAKTATKSFYQTDYCGEVDEDGACILSSVPPEDASKMSICVHYSQYDCSRRVGRYCVEIRCVLCCTVGPLSLQCDTSCTRGAPY